MLCCISELREKEIVNIRDGCRLGCVCDVELDSVSGRIISIIVYGKCKFMGVFGRSEDIKIYWDSIKVIGDDTILVDFEPVPPPPTNRPRGYIGR